jgi:hypothetical protein
VSDFSRDYHIVALSGWYYGKVGGLLGNIDNEPNNDLTTPEGETDPKLRKFLNSWEVDSSCRSTMAYSENEPKVKSPECSAVFDASSSSLRPCFILVTVLLICIHYYYFLYRSTLFLEIFLNPFAKSHKKPILNQGNQFIFLHEDTLLVCK